MWKILWGICKPIGWFVWYEFLKLRDCNKWRHTKNSLPLSVARSNRIYILSHWSELWVPKKTKWWYKTQKLWITNYKEAFIITQKHLTFIITQKKGLLSSLLVMDSKSMLRSNTENSKLLVFSNFVETSKKVLSLVARLFDLLSLPPFYVTLFFEWVLTRGPIEHTAKMKSFVILFDDYAIVHTFSQKVTWTLSSLPTTPLEEVCAFYIYIL